MAPKAKAPPQPKAPPQRPASGKGSSRPQSAATRGATAKAKAGAAKKNEQSTAGQPTLRVSMTGDSSSSALLVRSSDKAVSVSGVEFVGSHCLNREDLTLLLELPGAAGHSRLRLERLPRTRRAAIDAHSPNASQSFLPHTSASLNPRQATASKDALARLGPANSRAADSEADATVVLVAVPDDGLAGQPFLVKIGSKATLEEDLRMAREYRKAFLDFAPDAAASAIVEGRMGRMGKCAMQIGLASGRCRIPSFATKEGLCSINSLRYTFAEALSNNDAPESGAVRDALCASQFVCSSLLSEPLRRGLTVRALNLHSEVFRNVEGWILGKDHPEVGQSFFDGVKTDALDSEEPRGSLLSDGGQPADLIKLVNEAAPGSKTKPSQFFTSWHSQMQSTGSLWNLQAAYSKSSVFFDFDSILQDGEGRTWLAGCSTDQSMGAGAPQDFDRVQPHLCHALARLARWVLCGLLVYSELETTGDLKILRELIMIIAAAPEHDVVSHAIPPPPPEASSHVRFIWMFARRNLRCLPKLAASVDRPGLQLIWALMDVAIEIVVSEQTRSLPDRKRLALWASMCFAVRLSSHAETMQEPPWLQDRRKHWRTPDDGGLDTERIAASVYLSSQGYQESWQKDPVSRTLRKIQEDKFNWELIERRRPHKNSPFRSDHVQEWVPCIGEDNKTHEDLVPCLSSRPGTVIEGDPSDSEEEKELDSPISQKPQDNQGMGSTLRTVLETRRRLLITGEFGAGKSTFSQGVLADFVQQQLNSKVLRLPIRMSTDELTKAFEGGAADAISQIISERHAPDVGATLTWELLQPPPWCGRYGHQVVYLNQKKLFVMGGVSTNSSPPKALQDVWVSEDGGATWTELPTPSWPARSGHQVVAYEGKLILMGGVADENRRLRDAWESYDGSKWNELPCPKWSGRYGHKALVKTLSLKGAPPKEYVILMGGNVAGDKAMKDAWASDSGGFSWEELDQPPFSPRWNFSLVSWNHMLIVTGGCDETGPLNDAWVMQGNAWPDKGKSSTTRASLAAQRNNIAAEMAQGIPSTAFWQHFPDQPWGRRSQHQALPYRGQIAIFGGVDAKGNVLHDAWLSGSGDYWQELPKGTWSSASGRYGHQALVSEDGRPFVVGGAGGGRDMLKTRPLLITLEDTEPLGHDPDLKDYFGRLLRTEPWHFVVAVGNIPVPAFDEECDEPTESDQMEVIDAEDDDVEEDIPTADLLLKKWDFAELRVKPMEESHILAISQAWTQGMSAVDSEHVQAELLRQENRDLAGIPLTATMMLRALAPEGVNNKRRQRKNLNRCQLYNFVFKRCFQSNLSAKMQNVNEFERLSQQGLVPACAELAFDVLGRNSRSIKPHELANLTASLGTASEPMEKLGKLAQSGQLLLFEVDDESGLISFRFPSMQHYLAATHTWKQLAEGKGLPVWLVQENAAGVVSEAVASCASFFCLLAHGRGQLRKDQLAELREGLGFLFQTMCRIGNALAIRCLLGVAVMAGRQQLMAQAETSGLCRTGLHMAAAQGHNETVEALLDLAPDPMALCLAVDSEGLAPLHCAALHGHHATAQTLLRLSPDGFALLELPERSSTGMRPLHLAAKHGHTAVVIAFLEAGAPYTDCTPSGNTALHFAAAGGHATTVRALLIGHVGESDPSRHERAALLLSAVNKYDAQTALHMAADNGEEAVVATILELAPNRGALLLRTDKLGQTALHLAGEKGHTHVVNTLLKMAPDVFGLVDSRERITGQTALHMAAEAGHTETVRAVLEACPDHASMALGTDRCGCHLQPCRYTALHLAAEKGHTQTACVLLQMMKDKDKMDKLLQAQERYAGQTALHLAAGAGHSALCKSLLELAPNPGALLTARDRSGGFTSLQLACEKGHEEVVEVLLEMAPDRTAQLKDALVKWSGFTALHLAAYRGHEDAALAILRLAPDKKALLLMKDQRGRTPADLAADRGRRTVATLLSEAL
eukprot:TRINITY_DN21218_c0_g2_i3.p1 TRINITY_DN21218_c0_g2~~TRINITY_DN21218_c0_g2_i3.p1  ORF type:complete len:1958 (-),score=371.28 TRINITY_DN21218_c0_g2_i3:64-5937(-)